MNIFYLQFTVVGRSTKGYEGVEIILLANSKPYNKIYNVINIYQLTYKSRKLLLSLLCCILLKPKY